MRIQHNINALNSHRQLSFNNTQTGKNLEKLSSGYRINRAGDDAAGLAISEKMRGQINGLEQAQSNAQDGISLLQTAEGGLNETHSILQRMRKIAVQSSNGTYQNEVDRENLNKEMSALKSEIDRIATSTHFNKINLLNGEQGKSAVAGAGAAMGDITLGSDGQAASAAEKATYTLDLTGISAGDTIGTVFGVDVSAVSGTAASIAAAVNTALSAEFTVTSTATGVTITAKTAGKLTAASAAAYAQNMTGASVGTGEGVVTVVQEGISEAGGAPATRAKYDITLNSGGAVGGGQITLGDKTYEFTTGGSVSDGATAISIGQGLSAASIADNIKTALSTGTGYNVTVTANTTDGTYSISMTAKVAGTAANLGDVRFSNGVTGTATQVAGKDEGVGKEAKFAEVSVDIDFTKVKAGDKIKVGTVELEAVAADGDITDPTKQFKLGTTVGSSQASFATALESQAASVVDKVTFDGNKMTIKSNVAGTTAENFKTDLGITFTAGAGAGGGGGTGPADPAVIPGKGVTFQIGANGRADQMVTLNIENMTSGSLGVGDQISVSTQVAANAAIDLLDTAINTVSGTRADIGALQNRLEHTVNNLGVTTENLTAAESRIRDVDMAKEMMEYTKNNILTQAAQAMLAQANQQPQGVLQLLQ